MTIFSQTITWKLSTTPDYVKSPSMIKREIEYETAKTVDMDMLNNSILRIYSNKKDAYTRSQLNDLIIKLGGNVRGDKEKTIKSIRRKVLDILQ